MFRSKRLNIAVIAACPFPAKRGTSIRILRISEALARRGHRINVITYPFGTELSSDCGLHVHRAMGIPWGRSLKAGPSAAKLFVFDPLLVLRLFRFARSFPVDLVHAHHYEGLIAALILKDIIGKPVIYDAHTSLESELPQYSLPIPPVISKLIGRFMDRHIPRMADYVIAVSEALARELVETGGCERNAVTVIGDGIEPEIFQPIKAGQDISDPSERIIYAGSTAGFQNIDILIRAFERVRFQRPRARLIIVSEDDLSDVGKMLETSPAKGSVELVSASFEELPSHLARADVAVSPRLSCPGVSLKIMNYMAAGKPTVAFEGASTPLVHGVTGWVVEKQGEEALAGGIIRMLSDRGVAEKIGKKAGKEALERFSWDELAERTEEFYFKVLSG